MINVDKEWLHSLSQDEVSNLISDMLDAQSAISMKHLLVCIMVFGDALLIGYFALNGLPWYMIPFTANAIVLSYFAEFLGKGKKQIGEDAHQVVLFYEQKFATQFENRDF